MESTTGIKTALKKSNHRITRRVLVGTSEEETRPILEEVKRMVRHATARVPETVQTLRRDHGISLPQVSPEWDLVPTLNPTPLRTITAFEGNQSEVRITIYLDNLIDDTTTIQLEGLGISHLIGVSVSGAQNATWESIDPGGMIVVINAPVTSLLWLLHDILLDMAMVHAKAQPWSGIREQLNSHIIGELKSQFIRERNLLDRFPYGAVGECRYFPLAAFARGWKNENLDTLDLLDLKLYVELWDDFADFAKRKNVLMLCTEKKFMAPRIIASHVNGGQISFKRLSRRIDQLKPGHYCLYFLTRGTSTPIKVKQLSAFFKVPIKHFRTQRWIIYPRDKNARQSSIFMHEQFINIFSFYFGEAND